MNRTELETLHRALLKIKTDGPVGKYAGICYSLKRLGAPSFGQIQDIFRAWPKCNPAERDDYECMYPVDDRGYKKLWDNPLRHELLDFMIEYCEKELANETEDL